MEATKKLTKRQKKALAFRERKSNPKKEGNDILDMEDSEDVDLSEGSGHEVERVVKVAKVSSTKIRSDNKSKQKQKLEAAEEDGESSSPRGAKRKRGETDDNKDSQKLKRSKTEDDLKSQNQKFILFVGNLKYTTSKDIVQKHFSLCEPPPVIRLLTPKAVSPNAKTTKSKGCAFLEFQNKASLQQALKLHQSNLDGRMINVELTAGGGGKSETRMKKLKERNKELSTQRQKKVDKMQGKDVPFPQRPQRYSATSGLDNVPVTKHTWTVGDVDDGLTHRGGQRHLADGKKTRRPKAKDWATGVNAIPVG
ncbi:hypothetical protein BDQ17DRAFT_1395836 [Cyathus striatus]|nr:hypothetical protein BDQ17DRAFT_1395836 [Cyathus striatus]